MDPTGKIMKSEVASVRQLKAPSDKYYPSKQPKEECMGVSFNGGTLKTPQNHHF